MAPFIESLSDIINDFRSSSDNSTEDSAPCRTKINPQRFHLYLLIPSSVMIILLAFTITRKNKALDRFFGRPGAVYPMNILGKSHRSSYAAAWGSIAFLVADMVTQRDYALELHGPTIVKVLNAVISMFIYGVDYFPLFAALALESVTGYVVGTLYAWMLFAIHMTDDTDCNFSSQLRAIILLRDLPNTLCLGFLSISMAYKTFIAVKGKTAMFVSSTEKVAILTIRKTLEETSEGKHVLKLVNPVPPTTSNSTEIKDKILTFLKEFVAKWIYNKDSDFRYSARMVSIITICFCVVYKFTLEALALLLQSLVTALDILQDADSESISQSHREFLDLFIYLLRATEGCAITALTLTSLIAVVNILNTLTTYRDNMQDLYRGKCENVPLRSSRSGSDILFGGIKYAGYQAGYIAWGLIIHTTVLFLLAAIFALAITAINAGYYQWIVQFLRDTWPFIVMPFILWVVQYVASKLFLQGEDFAIDNRRALFSFSFFMFFYNVFLGFGSCLLRIIKSMVLGLLFLPRLDNSILPKKFQMFDPGYAAYVGFIHLECVHTHPVLVVFLRLLLLDHRSRGKHKMNKDASVVNINYNQGHNKIEMQENSKSRARKKWHLLYTLYNNPTLRFERKEYLDYVKKLRERIEKKQKRDNDKSEIGALVKGINNSLVPWAMEGGHEGGKSEQAGRSHAQMNWNALIGVNRFVRAARGARTGSMADAAKGMELAVLEMQNAMIDKEEEA